MSTGIKDLASKLKDELFANETGNEEDTEEDAEEGAKEDAEGDAQEEAEKHVEEHYIQRPLSPPPPALLSSHQAHSSI